MKYRDKLYKAVLKEAGREAVLAKCIEEMKELRDEIDAIILDISINKGISELRRMKFIDENADAINTMEQVTGHYDQTEETIHQSNRKLLVLQGYLDGGKLMDGLDMSVLK